jgi:ABC-type multidrug transport system permease subunit
MWSRIYAIFTARNREFLRDRGTLAWNLILPVILVFALAFIFGGAGRSQYTIGILLDGAADDAGSGTSHPFRETRYVEFVDYTDEVEALRRIEHHQLDLLVRFGEPIRYWVNPDSPRGYFAERILLQSAGQGATIREPIAGEEIRYVDWVLPGILGMNMMFSCLFGVGYVVVRYRKNGFLKRLRATPLRPAEFIIAQVLSRLVLILLITVFIYAGTHVLLGTRMDGSYVALFLVTVAGAASLVSLGLLVAARVSSEELAGGLLNMITWPMMILSGVWFSLEGASSLVQATARVFPLTHLLNAARAIMLDGAALGDVMPEILTLIAMSFVFLGVGALIFRWAPR